MSIPPEKIAELGELLKRLLVPDNEVIAQAYELLKGFFRDKRVVIALVHLVVGHPEWQVRQLAAVLLRQRLLLSWKRLSEKEQVKEALLSRVAIDEKPLVRQSVANVVAVVAKFEVGAGKWPQLLGFLLELFKSGQVSHREIGYYLLSVLAETMSQQLLPHLSGLLQTLGGALRDPESSHVRMNALSSLKEIAFQLSDNKQIEQFREIIPFMVQALQDFTAQGDDEGLSRAVEVFDELVECENPVLAKHMGSIFNTFLSMAANTNLEESSRIKVLNFIAWAVEYKPKSVGKNKIVAQLVATLMLLIAQDDNIEDTDDNNDPAEGDRLGPVAWDTLNSVAMHMPPEQVVPPLLEGIKHGMASAKPQERYASMIALANIAEGCSENLRPLLNFIVPFVLGSLKDPVKYVQGAGCFALSELGKNIQPEVAEYHPMIMPVLFEVLNTSDQKLLEKACVTLDIFCEDLGENILIYLQPLMERLIALLHLNVRSIQETAVCAIGSVAHSAEEKFVPYMESVLQTMSTALHLTGEADIKLRSMATDTIGTIATSVGLEAFKSFVQPLSVMVLQGVETIDDPQLRECSWMFFASMAQLTGAQFVSFLPVIMPKILESARLDPDRIIDNDEEDGNMATVKALAAEGEDLMANNSDDDGEEDLDESNFQTMATITTFVYEKEMAIAAIGEICLSVGEPFLPYVPESLEVLLELIENDQNDIRQSVAVALGQFLRAFNNIYMGGVQWQESRATQLPPDLNALCEKIMPAFIKRIQLDEDIEVVTTICQVITDNLSVLGPVMLLGATTLEKVKSLMLTALAKKLVCQETFDDDDDAQDANDDDEDLVSEKKGLLIDTAADVLGAASAVVGAPFASILPQLLPIVQKYIKPRCPVSERSMAVGMMAEIVHGIKEAVHPMAQVLVEFFIKAASTDPDDEVQRNAIYGLGCLCESGGSFVTPFYHHILVAIHPFFAVNRPASLLDNACGAVGRMILASPGALPLDQVVPVLLQFLPLREDFEESAPVVSALLLLLGTNVPAVTSSLPKVLAIFAKMLGPPMSQLKPEARQHLVATLKQHAQAFAPIVASLSVDEQTVLTSVVQQ